jgi:hypothetical protein
MTTHADFLADFAVSGEVCGAGLGPEPGAWVDALGPQFVDNDVLEKTLIRYYGFVSVTFRPTADRWLCDAITVKVGELSQQPDAPVPAAVTERYGSFPERVPFTDVADRLVAAGAEIHHVRRVHEAALELYWVPAGRVLFWLISPYQVEQMPELRLGDIYTVSTETGTAIPAQDLTRFR